jgi:hypothetical protein
MVFIKCKKYLALQWQFIKIIKAFEVLNNLRFSHCVSFNINFQIIKPIPQLKISVYFNMSTVYMVCYSVTNQHVGLCNGVFRLAVKGLTSELEVRYVAGVSYTVSPINCMSGRYLSYKNCYPQAVEILQDSS